MYHLEQVYGKKTYDAFKSHGGSPADLLPTQCSSAQVAGGSPWEAQSYEDLIEKVSFLAAMNKRLVLYFRGQTADFGPIIPQLFRKNWRCFDHGGEFLINTHAYWNHLHVIGERVKRMCLDIGVPRPRTLETREVQWAIIQHYGLWPTPLLDLTLNLRVAASFALAKDTTEGILYVCGMPNCTGSITFDIDQQLVLARLQSCCPPIAKRPHYQDGFLVGRFPLYSPGHFESVKSDLNLRLIAKFKLNAAKNNFWNPSFPRISEKALYPDDQDVLFRAFVKEFGKDGTNPVYSKDLELSNPLQAAAHN